MMTRLLYTCTALLCLPAVLLAQQETETRSGTVKEVKQKGRSTTLVVTDESGNDLEVLISPRMDFEIQAKGDAGFVKEGQVLQGQGTLSQEKIHMDNVTIKFVEPGKRISVRSQRMKAPPKPGQSQNAILVYGLIEAQKPDEDYPDYTLVAIKSLGAPYLMLKPGYGVTVVFQDPEMIPENAQITLEGTPLPRDRFKVSKATIKLPKPIKSEEWMKTPE